MTVSPTASATLALFILSIVFVIQPLKIPITHGKYIPLNLLTVPILIILILWASQCIGATTIRDGITGTDGVKPYNILILFFSLAYMSITLDVTGVLKAAAHLVSNVSGKSGTKLYINFYLMVTALSAILGNDPVILSGTIFLLYYTDATGLDGIPWLMTEFAAANTASMILFVGNPTNVVICEGFGIQNAAFTAYTILPFVACSVTCLLAVFLQFRATKLLKPRLDAVEYFDVKKDITDPVSAVVGSVLLGGCLITALVVSFLNVDVWKITLPFASAKFIFDIMWDLYRTRAGNKDNETRDEEASDSGKRSPAEKQSEKIEPPTQAYSLPNPPTPKFRSGTPDASNTERSNTLVDDELVPQAAKLLGEQLAHAMHEKIDEEKAEEVPDRDPIPVEGEQPENERQQQPSVANGANKEPIDAGSLFVRIWRRIDVVLKFRQPTLYSAFPRLPFALVPFAFSQFILIEALVRQGWINIFARWLAIATGDQMFPTIWLVGVLGILLCNIAGTNIGATILLTKVVRAANLSAHSTRAAGVALALASNIGAVSFVFSASLAGLLWKGIIDDYDKTGKNKVTQRAFAKWNLAPLLVMTSVGLAVVSAEMAVLYRHT